MNRIQTTWCNDHMPKHAKKGQNAMDPKWSPILESDLVLVA